MKFLNKYMLMSLSLAFAMSACDKDDVKDPGNPVMEYDGLPSTVCFGDSLPFTVKASDSSVPLSTVKAELYLDGELVGTKSVRTKVSGETYTGRVFVPYMPYATGTKGKLRLVLQNINFTTTETEVEFDVEYPEFPYLTLVAEDGNSYRLDRAVGSRYEATGEFPGDISGIIIAPACGDNGNELRFGYKGESIEQGGTSTIKFRSLVNGAYTLSFDTFTYEYGPVGELKFDDQDFTMVSGSVYRHDFHFTQNQQIQPVGFPDFSDWWIDADYFVLQEDGTLKFNAYDGYYRVDVDLDNKYFTVKKIDEYGELEPLQADGSGTIWLMGTGVGKPDYASHQIGWVPANMVPFAPVAPKKFRLTLIAGKSLSATKFTLRIFNQPGWGATFKPERLTLATDQLMIGVPGKEAHNIYLATGVQLEEGATYEILVDLTAGNDVGVLTLTKL